MTANLITLLTTQSIIMIPIGLDSSDNTLFIGGENNVNAEFIRYQRQIDFS